MGRYRLRLQHILAKCGEFGPDIMGIGTKLFGKLCLNLSQLREKEIESCKSHPRASNSTQYWDVIEQLRSRWLIFHSSALS